MEQDFIAEIRSTEAEAEQILQAAQESSRKMMEAARRAKAERLEKTRLEIESWRQEKRAALQREAEAILASETEQVMNLSEAKLEQAAQNLAERIVKELERR